MFNPLKPDELILGVGNVLLIAARSEGALDDFQRSQLLSAYSITRLLAAEELVATRLLAWLRAELQEALAGVEDRDVLAARERIAAAAGGLEIGDTLAELLSRLREESREPELRERLHAVLRAMIELELAALAARRAEERLAA